MNLALPAIRPLRLSRPEAEARRGWDAATARAAALAGDLVRGASWPRMAGAAALGFAAGVAVLGGRKVFMQATTGVAGDWFAALKADHKLVDNLFELLMQTSEADAAKRQALFAKITYALAKHQFEEEHVIYPALLGHGPPETPRHLDAEHFEMKTLVHELAETAKDEPAWLPKARTLHRLIQAHVREEETIVFPRLHETVPALENLRLTKAMHREGLKLA